MTLRWRFDPPSDVKITAELRAAGERGLLLAAEFVLSVSDQRVPLEWGTLAGSGETSVDGLTAAVSYGTAYAVRQHEELTYRHPNGRQAKYLETAFADSVDEVRAIIAAQLRRAFR